MPLTMEELEFKFRWWCCLALLERLQLTATVLEFQTLLGFIPKQLFDQFWTTFGGTVDDWRYQYFIVVYPLVFAEIELEDGTKVEVYLFEDFWWFELSAFTESPDFLCVTPCRILTYSTE